MLEAGSQPRDALLGRHVCQRPSRHLSVLSHAAHIARAALSVLAPQKVVNRYSVVAGHRRIILAMMATLMGHHMSLLLYVMQKARTNSSVATLIAHILILIHLLGLHHFRTRNLASGGQCLGCTSVNVHRILCL